MQFVTAFVPCRLLPPAVLPAVTRPFSGRFLSNFDFSLAVSRPGENEDEGKEREGSGWVVTDRLLKSGDNYLSGDN